jgi:hypothetical protein
LDQSGQFNSDFTRSVTFSGVSTSATGNPFLASTKSSLDSTDGVPLAPLAAGSTIFREIDEQHSLSKVNPLYSRLLIIFEHG